MALVWLVFPTYMESISLIGHPKKGEADMSMKEGRK